MTHMDRQLEALSDAAGKIHEDLDAIFAEHIPEQLRTRVNAGISDLLANAYEQADHNAKRLYRALVGLTPEHSDQIRDAFAAVCFEGCRCDDATWRRWLSDLDWAFSPRELEMLDTTL